MLEIHEVREGVEAQAARLCAEHAGPAPLRSLADVLGKQAEVVDQESAAGWYDTNTEFHRLIAEGAGNRRMAEVLFARQRQMRLGLRRVSSRRDQRRPGLAEHRAIFAAIQEHDPRAAEQLMRAHIASTRSALADRLEPRGTATQAR